MYFYWDSTSYGVIIFPISIGIEPECSGYGVYSIEYTPN